MSKAVKTIIGVVAAIAIPFAAPAIASAIGTSMGISAATFGMSATVGSVVGSAAVGAVLGGATQAILGGDVGRGALMGALGGGFGGYTSAPAAAPAAGAAPPPVFDATPTGLVPAPGYGAPAATGLTGIPQTAVDEFGQIIAAPSPTVAAPTGLAGAQTTVNEFGQVTAAPAAPAAAPTAPAAGLQGVPQTVPMGPQTAQQLGAGFNQQMTAAGISSRPVTFAEAVRAIPGEIAAKFNDPKTLADMTLRAAGNLAGSAIAGDGLSDQERALLNAQTEELRTLQQTNQALFNQKLEQAQNLIGESKYFDPEYYGLQRARRAQTAAAKAKRTGLRGLEGSARAAESRRFDLATARDVGTAYDQGFMSATQPRLQTMVAGLQMMPTGYPSAQSEYANLRRAYSDAETRAGNRAKNFGDMYGSIIGIPQSQSRGD